MAQCTAKSKRSGERCRRHAMKGKSVCYMHGGKSLAGAEAPSFRTGRYSRYLPDRLADRYREALEDVEITRLEDEIALLDSRLRDVIERLTTAGEGPDAWRAADEGYRDLRAAVLGGDGPAAQAAIRSLDAVFARARREYASWREVTGLIEQRRRLVETERKRLADEDRAMTADRVMILVAAIIDIVRRNVGSREQRGAIANEIRALVAGNNGAG